MNLSELAAACKKQKFGDYWVSNEVNERSTEWACKLAIQHYIVRE